MNTSLKVILGSEINSEQISEFNQAWQCAFQKDKQPLTRETINPKDVHFFVYSDKELVGIGRCRYITNIKIGNKVYEEDFWGGSDLGVCGQQGKGLGTQILNYMIYYAQTHGMKTWIGFHGKKTSLIEFYRKFGLEIDENLGAKIYKYSDDLLTDMSHTNVSYLKGDPFIDLIRETNEPVVIPYSW